MHVDLNELGEAAYNEFKRIKFFNENIDHERMTDEDLFKCNDAIYNKIGDILLKQIVKYKDFQPDYMSYDFNSTAGYTLLLLVLALCYINNMNLNDYFNIRLREDYE